MTEKPYAILLDDEGDATAESGCSCQIKREKGRVSFYQCDEHKDMATRLEKIGELLGNDCILTGQDLIDEVAKMERMRSCVGRAIGWLDDDDLGLAPTKAADADEPEIDDWAEAAYDKILDLQGEPDFADIAEKLLAATGMTWDDWQCGNDPWLRCKFNPVEFLVSRLRALAPERLAESVRQAEKGATFHERHPGSGPALIMPDFVNDLRKRVEMLEREVKELKTAQPKRKRKGDAT